jgi:hypothetical protein
MRITDVPHLGCAKPLLFDTGLEDFPYAAGGSSFLILHRACLLLVTADHCLRNNRTKPSEVLVLDASDGRTFLTFDRVSVGKRSDDDEVDFVDFAIFRIRQDTVNPDQLRRLHPFPISERTIIKPDDPRVRGLVARGFPLDLNAIDYEQQRIPQVSVTTPGVVESPDPSQAHMFIMRYAAHGTPVRHDTDGNGVSGGVVLAAVDEEPQVRLAGMVIRGGRTSGIWRFQSVRVLWSALRDLDRRGEISPFRSDLGEALSELLPREPAVEAL